LSQGTVLAFMAVCIEVACLSFSTTNYLEQRFMNRSVALSFLATTMISFALIAPTAYAGNNGVPTPKATPVIVTNAVTIANPVGSVTISNQSPIPVSGIVGVSGAVPLSVSGVAVDAGNPLPVKPKSPNTYIVPFRITSNDWYVTLAIPKPAILESAATNCASLLLDIDNTHSPRTLPPGVSLTAFDKSGSAGVPTIPAPYTSYIIAGGFSQTVLGVPIQALVGLWPNTAVSQHCDGTLVIREVD
jgi:hypothetical protein